MNPTTLKTIALVTAVACLTSSAAFAAKPVALSKIDTNGDNVLSRNEVIAADMDPLAAYFADRDGDRNLDANERKTYQMTFALVNAMRKNDPRLKGKYDEFLASPGFSKQFKQNMGYIIGSWQLQSALSSKKKWNLFYSDKPYKNSAADQKTTDDFLAVFADLFEVGTAKTKKKTTHADNHASALGNSDSHDKKKTGTTAVVASADDGPEIIGPEIDGPGGPEGFDGPSDPSDPAAPTGPSDGDPFDPADPTDL